MLPIVIQQYIVGDIRLAQRHLLFDNGVPPLPDVYHQPVVHIGADILVLRCHGSKRQQAVQLRHDIRIHLHLRHIVGQREHQLIVETILYHLYLLFRRQNLVLVLFEFLCDIALGIGERLLANPLGWHLLFVGVTHLKVVAEDVVIADFQALNACFLDLTLLQAQQVFFAVGMQVAQVVQLAVHASCDDSGSPLHSRGIGLYLTLYASAHLRAGLHLVAEQR